MSQAELSAAGAFRWCLGFLRVVSGGHSESALYQQESLSTHFAVCVSCLPCREGYLSLENILIIRAFELVFGAVAQKPVKLMYIWFYGLQSTFLHVTSRFL